MIYYIIFITLAILAFFNDVVQSIQMKKYRKHIFVLCSIFLILFGATRFQTGYDYLSYEQIFTYVSNMNLNSVLFSNELNIEKGYLVINYMLKDVDYGTFLFIVTSFSICCKLIYFYKNTNKQFIVLLFYYASIFITYDMGVLRQSIAIGVLLWGYKAIEERNVKKFIVLVLVASSFHITSLVMLPLYFMKDKNYNRIFYYSLIIGSLVAMYSHMVSTFIPFVSNVGGDIMSSKLQFYSSASYIQVDITLNMLKRIVVFILFYEYVRYKKVTGNIYLYINAYLLSIIISCSFCDVTVLAGRGTVILYLTQIIIFAYLIEKDKEFSVRCFVFATVLLLSLVSLNGPIQDKNDYYLPYKSNIEELIK